MRLTLRQMEVLVEIAHSRSATAAGEALSMSQSAVSAALAELEAQLGERVFDRVGKRLVLNDSGRLLLPRAMAILDQTRGIEALFGAGAAALRLGASSTVGNAIVPDIMAAFCREFPAAQFCLRVGNTQSIAEAVAQFEVDLGLVEGACHRDDLAIQPWLRDDLVVVCAPGNPLAGREVGLDELRAARWLLREVGSGTRETVETLLLDQLHGFDRAMVLGSSEAIRSAAIVGLGVACMPRRLVRDALERGQLVTVRSPLAPMHRTLYIVHHQKKTFSQALQRFLQFCQTWQDDVSTPD
ncbi:MAG: LysR family transcriptional regulator [Thiomonas sp.]|uniref:LysR family transcriptional regulator n=1 Tax=Thiomonas sp. TaxID=2047785 RepID=UPI002A363EE6|nr:LysR family transcriptional regulator [Thiomonas sp.]MDY0328932.1 LysR family transcriptional regulator [Thiomonas sp.]